MKIRLLSLLLMWVLLVPAWAASAVTFQNLEISYKDGKLNTVKKHRKLASTAVVGKIVSMSASDHICIAATADGQIYLSTDGLNWKMSDFNAKYAQYYGQITVRCVCASSDGLMMAGVGQKGQPVAFESTQGGVWSERELTYSSGGSIYTLKELPLDLSYDHDHSRFVLTCTDNVLFYLPGCSHCNSIQRL